MGKRLERMIDIIDTMLDGRRRTGVELSYKYGVSRSTIYRDISQLSMILPIVTYYGRNAGGELLSMNSLKYGLVQKSEIRYLLTLLEKEAKNNPQAKTLSIKIKNCFKFLSMDNEQNI